MKAQVGYVPDVILDEVKNPLGETKNRKAPEPGNVPIELSKKVSFALHNGRMENLIDYIN